MRDQRHTLVGSVSVIQWLVLNRPRILTESVYSSARVISRTVGDGSRAALADRPAASTAPLQPRDQLHCYGRSRPGCVGRGRRPASVGDHQPGRAYNLLRIFDHEGRLSRFGQAFPECGQTDKTLHVPAVRPGRRLLPADEPAAHRRRPHRLALAICHGKHSMCSRARGAWPRLVSVTRRCCHRGCRPCPRWWVLRSFSSTACGVRSVRRWRYWQRRARMGRPRFIRCGSF